MSLRLRCIMLISAAVLMFASPRAVIGQADAAPDVRISASKAITAEYAAQVRIEPHLTVHPYDPGHVVAVAMITEPEAEWAAMRERLTYTIFVSRDAGSSWNASELPLTTCYDPWLTFTRKRWRSRC